MWGAMTHVREGPTLERGRKAGAGNEDRTRELVAAQRVQRGSGGHRECQVWPHAFPGLVSELTKMATKKGSLWSCLDITLPSRPYPSEDAL